MFEAALSAAAVELQQHAQERMTDTCTITRPGQGDPVFDPGTGTYTDPEPVTVYEGKCRVRPTNVDRSMDAGETRVHVWHSVISVPLSVTDIGVNDTVTITASRDGALVGKVYTVGNVDEGSAITARRLGCNQETS